VVNGIGDDGHGFVLRLGKRQHRGELFSLTAHRRFDALIPLDHLQTLRAQYSTKRWRWAAMEWPSSCSFVETRAE
jgi:hypothetical protein